MLQIADVVTILLYEDSYKKSIKYEVEFYKIYIIYKNSKIHTN